MKNVLFSFVLIAFAAIWGGCRTAPIQNLSDNAVIASSDKLTLEDVATAIKKGGSAYGWQMRTVKPGLIEATLHVRHHTAVVDIPFDTKSYSINYKSSENLNYDGQTIHSQYFVWVRNLRAQINKALGDLASRR